MKSGPVREFHTLNWRFNFVHTDGTKALFNDKGEWSAKAKVQAALTYALTMRSSGRAYPADQDAFPVEVRTSYFGTGPPPDKPPQHGDEF